LSALLAGKAYEQVKSKSKHRPLDLSTAIIDDISLNASLGHIQAQRYFNGTLQSS